MNEPSTRAKPKMDVNRVRNMVESNESSNTNVQQRFHNGNRQKNRSFTNGLHQQQPTPAPIPLLEALQAQPLLTSKPFEKPMSARRRRNRPFGHERLARSNDDQVDKPDISPGKIEIGRTTIDIREPTSEHLVALKNAFDKIVLERSLTEISLKQRQIIYNRLRQIILAKQPDCQIHLYGSILFECCLEKPGIIDIDVQFKEILQYDTLKELLEIILKSDLCKEARIDTEHKPSCIDLVINEPNMRVRLTSGYTRGIVLSKMIRIYTKFDGRVLKLLRLFRILAKTCNIDKPDLGTLHPMVFHVMLIHFLQQLEQPVLPCLHEHVFGIDAVPVTLNDNQYSDFFRVCNEYARVWKSKNTTSVEMLFLQLLSYYVKTFNTKQFVVSIQTRMPVIKADKNWHSRKLLVEDPTDIKRSLCQTMQAVRSIDYFRHTFNTTLNYFGRKQKKIKKVKVLKENEDDDLIEVVAEDQDEIPTIEPANALHNSYKLFFKRLPPTVARDINIRQARVRDYYKQTFDKTNPPSQPILKLSGTNKSPLFSQDNGDDVDEVEEAFRHDLEADFERMDANDEEDEEQNPSVSNENIDNEMSTTNEYDDTEINTEFDELTINEEKQAASRQLFPSSEEEQQPTAVVNGEQSAEMIVDQSSNENNEEGKTINDKVKKVLDSFKPSTEVEKTDDAQPCPPSPVKTPPVTTNNVSSTNNIEDDSSPFTSPVKVEQVVAAGSPPATNPSSDNSIELFYDFQAENFDAEQGAPFVCTTCNGIGHVKSECPELIVPDMIDLPKISKEWLDILSRLCRQITDRCRPTQTDTDNREKILKQLRLQFQKDFPDCKLHAFGSFYNGFGFRQSDLDVCIVFDDEREENNEEVIHIMQKLLRSMRSNREMFEYVQPVLHAKVPIIRSRHTRLQIEIDISLHNMLAIENTELLKTYTLIDSRVAELGYMIKHLAKTCDIGDASRGTLSSYTYIIMVIHFLQQIQPPVLPVLQQLTGDPTKKTSMYRKCSKWNVYFYKDLTQLNTVWPKTDGGNTLTSGALWIELLRYYTEQFNYDDHVVTIRRLEPLLRHEKGWFRPTLAVEDPFELSHNLAGGLSIRNWTLIRRVFIRARQQFGLQPANADITHLNMENIEKNLFSIDDLCPTNAPKRCEWCNGPYHIRKRCPKLATLANEKEKMKQAEQQQSRGKMSGPGGPHLNGVHHPYPSQYQPQYFRQYSHPPAMSGHYQYPIMPEPGLWMQPYSNGAPLVFTNSNYYPGEQQMAPPPRYYHPSNTHSRACFLCGNTDHLKAQCPQLRINGHNNHR